MEGMLDNSQLLGPAVERIERLSQTELELRQSAVSKADQEYLRTHCRFCIEYVAEACKLYASRPCLGWRRSNEPFRTQSFARVWQRTEQLATAWQRSGQVRPGDFVGICGFGSPDYVVTELACLYLAAVSVPLQTNLKSEEMALIINETEMCCVACSVEQLPLLQRVLPRCPSVKSVVVIDDPEWEGNGQSVLPSPATLASLEQRFAEQQPVPYIVPGRDIDPDPLLTILYTSGSTGSPKGAMFPESVWVQSFSGSLAGRMPPFPVLCVGDLPLNHIGGRTSLYYCLLNGGVTYFPQKSDMSTLFDDLRAVRPTVLLLVPRISEQMFYHYQAECAQRGGGEAVEAEVLASMQYFVGDRLVYALTGGAPTAPRIMEFLKRCLRVPIYDIYGTTECSGSMSMDGHLSSTVESYKLVDLPELGYLTSDTPYPRGELCIKSPRMIRGYYKHPELTSQLFDADGFLRTGDIVEERGPRQLVSVDRAKNILKLAQGKFVSVSHLENLYVGNSPFIAQMYLYGNSERAYLLAVLVPNAAALRAKLKEGADNALTVKQFLRQELDRVARATEVHGYEVPRDFLVEMQPFTKENGLLTETAKPARRNLQQHYAPRLEQCYEQLESHIIEELRTLLPWKNRSVAERVQKAISITLGLTDVDLDQCEQSFIQLGGDSLSAVRLREVIEELCAVAVPVGSLLDVNTSVQDIAKQVESLASASPSATRYATIHGKDATVVHGHQLRLDAFVAQAAEESTRALPASVGPAQTVLLTGASGFLGRFLLLDLLTVLTPQAGQVVCLIRARDKEGALARLRDTYERGGRALCELFLQATASGRLQVYAGDLMQPRMGLSAQDYEELSQRVDTIVHNGALVNHALTYPQLFEPNVLGTAEVMRFAVQHRRKALSFISSVGVAAGLARPVLESDTAAALWQSRAVDGGYASGYCTSKWACEVLLAELHAACGVPVQVFRCSMLLGHSQALGQINASDVFTRLLYGIIHTGLAPRSFYGSAGPQHYNGVPVDFAAGSIAALSVQRSSDHRIYHVINPHRADGASLDTIVDWVESAGYPIERLWPHAEWFRRFKEALRALPDIENKQRSYSPLPTLQQWEHPAERIPLELDAARFQEALRTSTRWQDVPKLSEPYIHRFLQNMAHLGLIKRPRSA